MPKRGFNNAEFKKRWGIVNLSALEKFDAGATIDESLLRANGLISGDSTESRFSVMVP
jgi:large subunit ribosomal protein L15